jgi:hypothetical protein
MDPLKTIDEVAEIDRRLTELSDTHRKAMSGGDHDLISRLQEEISRLGTRKQQLLDAMPKKPPGITGNVVR